MQPIYYHQTDIFLLFKELRQTSDGQVKLHSVLHPEHMQPLHDLFDKLMLIFHHLSLITRDAFLLIQP